MITPPPVNVDKILSLLSKHPLELDYYAYGTAGFRYSSEVMTPVMVRVGLVMRFLLLSLPSNKKDDMGVMITASHNDESYNGIKISNPDGSMIGPVQEELLLQWVNERDETKWRAQLQQGPTSPAWFGKLHVGQDTRSHSPKFAAQLMDAAEAMGVQIVDHEIVTTPMLHHIVLYSNKAKNEDIEEEKYKAKEIAHRDGYLKQMAKSYKALDELLLAGKRGSSNLTALQVDGACGVGYQATVDLQATLTTLDSSYEGRFQARNSPNVGPLNDQCGSEHVQKQLQPPTWYDGKKLGASSTMEYCCSLDGDADRIVFFSTMAVASDDHDKDEDEDHKNMTLLDGDKIAVLIAHFVQKLQQEEELPKNISVGVIQTAYANGASTAYLRDTLELPVVITKTGVKHLHHAAMKYDIGIYFEANGHGTVLFSEKYHEVVANNKEGSSPILQWLPKLINPAVGDALSDLLLVDLLLRYLNWSLVDWATKLYTDLPSRQLKVKVKDRSMIQCNANETEAVEPPTLQPALQQAMAEIGLPTARVFVRPSGTENVVRIYAEAKTRKLADELATQAAQIVYDQCQGLGPVPRI